MYELSGVTKDYQKGRGTIHALDGVDLVIADGDWLAIQGPTGHGKSTLLQILGALDRPTSGTVRFGDQDLARLRESQLTGVRATSIGFIFQSFNLIPTLSAQENVETALVPLRVPAAERRERAHRALADVSLGDRARHLPSELSGGQQQRVAIARALVKEPRVLLADEPTGNLDEDTRDEIITLLDQLWAELSLTLVMVSHDSTVAGRAQRTGLMSNGRLTIQARPANTLPSAATPAARPGASLRPGAGRPKGRRERSQHMPSRKRTTSVIVGAAAIVLAGGSYWIVSAASSTSHPAAASASSAGSSAPGGGANARSGPAAGGASGTVTSVSASGFTMTTSAGQKVTVDEASATTYRKGTTAVSASAITTGEPLLVLGTTSSTTITATQVTVQPAGSAATAASSAAAGVIPFQRGTQTTAKQVGQIPANYTEGQGTIVSGTTANKATEAALASYPGGIVDRVVRLSNGEYEVHNIGVNWPHHVFVSQDFKVVGAD